jgi:hypothetical protein
METILSAPSIDKKYKTKRGEDIIVIGHGTRGIVIEYTDGRVELVSQQDWAQLADPSWTATH